MNAWIDLNTIKKKQQRQVIKRYKKVNCPQPYRRYLLEIRPGQLSLSFNAILRLPIPPAFPLFLKSCLFLLCLLLFCPLLLITL